jgi:hypothetical protein
LDGECQERQVAGECPSQKGLHAEGPVEVGKPTMITRRGP